MVGARAAGWENTKHYRILLNIAVIISSGRAGQNVKREGRFFQSMHSGRNQGFLSNGCIWCIYLVKILTHCTQGGWLDTLDIDILFTIHIDIL